MTLAYMTNKKNHMFW